MEKSSQQADLADIRKVIDETDQAIFALLEKRFAAVERVKVLKSRGDAHMASPIRPAREAVILRQLIRAQGPHVPLDVRVRVWRCIFGAATRLQAPVRIHIGPDVEHDASLRDIVREHFAGLPFVSKSNPEEALESLAHNKSDVMVVATSGHWIDAFQSQLDGGAKIIARLPAIGHVEKAPKLLVIGHAEAEPSGHDETLVIATGKFPLAKDLPALWRHDRLISLSGFISATALHQMLPPELVKFVAIAGRCPCPIEMTT